MKYISYYRLSKVKTADMRHKKEGEKDSVFRARYLSQGLKAQKELCRRAVKEAGGEIIAEYKEIESGYKSRPILKEAVDMAIEQEANLVVAKTDRLSRDTLSAMLLKKKMEDSGLKILFADNPQMSEMEFMLRCIVAQEEWKMHSKRQRDVVEYSKRNGTKTGNWYGNPVLGSKKYNIYRKMGSKKVQENAKLKESNKRIFDFIKLCVEEIGVENKNQIVKLAKKHDVKSSEGADMNHHTITRILKMFEYTPIWKKVE